MQQDLPTLICAKYPPPVSALTTTAKKALIAPLYLSLIAGTGGICTPSNLHLAFTNHQNQVIEIRGYHTKRNPVLSISQLLRNIREMFGLKMSDVAIVFGVTRPAAYAWINGAEPRLDIKAKIYRLHRLVEDLESAGIANVGPLARQPIANDQSLVDLLKSGGDVNAAIVSIKQTAMQSMQRESVRAEFGPSSRRRRVSVDAISVPIVGDFGE